ncbi:hypothetical protein MHBO_001346 [Bonamia ostreae]|uniref:Uncharacterized protein n=1 Tax=Bonamia ostreae TaxID=126728 RepID=A0ABV2AIM9_9EUKA
MDVSLKHGQLLSSLSQNLAWKKNRNRFERCLLLNTLTTFFKLKNATEILLGML